MRQKGFTLIELLIAMAAMSVIMTVIYTSLSSSINAIEGADSSIAGLQDARSALDNLRREIESSIYNYREPSTHFRFMERDFMGRAASDIQFASLSYSARGLFIIAYKTEEEKNKLRLLKKIYTLRADPEKIQWQELMEDIYSFSVQAYKDGELVKTWDSAVNQSLPQELRLSITVKTGRTESESNLITLTDIARIRINRSLQD